MSIFFFPQTRPVREGKGQQNFSFLQEIPEENFQLFFRS